MALLSSAGSVRRGPVLGSDCTVYAVGVDGQSENTLISAFRDNQLTWQASIPGEASTVPTVDATGNVYVHSHEALHAFDREGNPRWTLELGGGPVRSESSSPVIGPDGTLYVGTFNAERLFAVSPAGELLWSTRVGRSYSTPALDGGGSIYIGIGGAGELVKVGSDGTILWRAAADGYLHTAPVIGSDGTIYTVSLVGTLYAHGPDGRSIWTLALGDGSWSAPALSVTGVLYVLSGYFSGLAVLHAIGTDGNEMWRHEFGPHEYRQQATPTVGADGTVYVSTANALHAFAPDGGLLWSYDQGGGSGPAVIGPQGTLYAGQALQTLQ